MSLITIVGIRDTPQGPQDIDSIDGEEITVKMVDGELTISNGASGIFGTFLYSLQDLIGEQESAANVRIEIRIKD